jgi:PPOX class probable F420-dependent enzyme
MPVEFTQEVSRRLDSDKYGWLTTVARSGQPVPKLVWFYFDGADVILYSMPGAAKVRHVKAHPRVSLNLDSTGDGAGIVTVGGEATIDAVDVDGREDGPFWNKYKADAERFGLAEAFAEYSTRIKITVDKVWTTPTEP